VSGDLGGRYMTEARAEYFRAADKVLKKINQKFGTGREGFLNFLNNKDVESGKPQKDFSS